MAYHVIWLNIPLVGYIFPRLAARENMTRPLVEYSAILHS